jgi:multiple antibiotic resistance protein
MDWALIGSFFIAMLAISNPLNKIPLWVQGSADQDGPVRWRLALMVTGSALVILLVFLIGGQAFLNLFGIDLSSFKVGGGIVILLVGLDMLRGTVMQIHDDAPSEEDRATTFGMARARFRQIAVPMAVPFTAGPGSISTAVVYSARASTTLEYLGLAVVLTVVMVIVFLVLLGAPQVERLVGDTVLNLQTRVFGLILAGIGVQLMAEGLGALFPAWVTDLSPIADELELSRP